MAKKTRYEIYVLCGLAVVLVLAFYSGRSQNNVFTGVHADDGKFEPLAVPDPSLRLGLLAQIQKNDYNGQRRNIFSEEPLPPPPDITRIQNNLPGQQIPPAPVAPPPVVVPATFYGIVTNPATGKKQACFSGNADNIYIVPEGGTLLNQFRVVKIGNNTVEMQEIASGRNTTLTLPEGGTPPNAPQMQAAQQ